MGKLVLALLISLVCSHVAAGQTEAVKATLCEISKRPSAYNGKLVRIRAVYAGSFEGSYLVDPACGKSVWFTTPEGIANVAAILVHSPYPKVPPVSFQLVKDREYERFTKLAYATVGNFQPEYEVTTTFTGRIDRCKNFQLDKKGFGNGFGQMDKASFNSSCVRCRM